MKIPDSALRKAAAKKRRREGQQAPAPKRSERRAPSPAAQRDPPAVPEVDLTGDSPSAGEPVPEPLVEAPVIDVPVATEEPSTTEEPAAPCDPAPTEQPRDWGEGPSGVANAHDPSPVSSSPRDGPENAEGSGVAAKPARDSVFNDLRWAESLISSILVPEAKEEVSHLTAATFFRESYAAVVRIVTSLATSREVIHTGKILLREVQQEADEARARAETAEKALESVQADCQNRIKEAENRIKEAENRMEVARRREATAINQMTMMEGAVEARNLRILDLEQSLEAEVERARVANGEAEKAKDRARVAEEEADQARSERDARIAEVEVAAEGRVIKAIEDFKVSQAFEDELAEASAGAYLSGFQRGKEKVAQDLDFPRALEVEPDSLSESGSDGDAQAAP